MSHLFEMSTGDRILVIPCAFDWFMHAAIVPIHIDTVGSSTNTPFETIHGFGGVEFNADWLVAIA